MASLLTQILAGKRPNAKFLVFALVFLLILTLTLFLKQNILEMMTSGDEHYAKMRDIFDYHDDDTSTDNFHRGKKLLDQRQHQINKANNHDEDDTSAPNFTKRHHIKVVKKNSCYNYKPNMAISRQDRRHLKPRPMRRQLDCARRPPKVLLIGAKKCGTTSLKTFLDLHPQIETKTVFDFQKDLRKFSLDEFLRNMPMTTPDQLALVNNPGFMNAPQLLEYLSDDSIAPDLKFILILRDPINRAVSDYVHVLDLIDALTPKEQQKMGKKFVRGPDYTTFKKYEVRRSFEETVIDNHGNVNGSHPFIKMGIYIDRLKKLFQYISRNRTLIIDGDKMKENPIFVMKEVEHFLGIFDFFTEKHFYLNSEHGFYCARVTGRPDLDCMGDKKGRPHPKLDQSLLQKLKDFFQRYNLQLQEFLNLTLSFTQR